VTAYAWVKLLHICAIAIWSAGLLYLPGLFAEHPKARTEGDFRRVRQKTRFVFVTIASPAAVIAVVTGTVMIPMVANLGGWLVLKLIGVAGLVMLHAYHGRLMARLLEAPAMRSPAAHLLLILPAILLVVAIIFIVSLKPL